MWRSAALLVAALGASAAEPPRPAPLQGGVEFQSADVRALQADEFANPGMLWVARGEALWAKSCAACHGEAARSMRGVAASYPKHDAGLGRVVDLDGKVRACATRSGEAPAWESEALLALTAYVARQSLGARLAVSIDGPARAAYERGRTLYFERQGQLNIACTQCHDANWGRMLLAERISQGHPVDWPAYRLEWQAVGSLQRRLRACYYGVRAEMPAFGSADLAALQLYLAARAQGLPLAVPGVRR